LPSVQLRARVPSERQTRACPFHWHWRTRVFPASQLSSSPRVSAFLLDSYLEASRFRANHPDPLVMRIPNARRCIGFRTGDLTALPLSSLFSSPQSISLFSRTCRPIRFNLKSFNQCVQAALDQNVGASRYLVRIKHFHLRLLVLLLSPLHRYAPICWRVSCTLPAAYPRTWRNELIRQSDEGRAAACTYACTYRCLTKRGVIPSRRFTVTKET